MIIWKNRPVLVTGATGFIGRKLLERLLAEDADVTTLGRTPQTSEQMSKTRVRVATATEDIASVIAETRPDVVFHLASHAISQHSPADIDRLVDANVRLPTQLCDAMARAGCRAIVSMGSAWQHAQGLPYAPICLYAATKQAMQDVFQYYYAAHTISSIVLKLFHTYGPGEVRPRLVSQLCEAATTGRVLKMSEGRQVINLTHIDDVVEGLLVAGSSLLEGAAGAASYSIGGDISLTIRDLVSLVEKTANAPLRIEWGALPYKPMEFFEPIAMGSRLPSWSPRTSLERGLRGLLNSQGMCRPDTESVGDFEI